MLLKTSLSDAMQRRRLSRWALLHAWKLAGLTALVTFVGVFIAVSLSLVLRPTRSYVFPLLSDIDKHQPEGAILRLAFVTATALFFATTTASVLHCHSLRFFAPSDRPSPEHLLASSPVAPAGAAVIALDHLPPLDDSATAASQAPPLRRRSLRITSMQAAALALIVLTAFLTLSHLRALPRSLLVTLQGARLATVIFNILFYTIIAIWAFGFFFLIWYFLKLQTMPDRPPGLPVHLPAHTATIASPPPDSLPSDATDPTDDTPPPQHPHRITGRLRAFATWVVLILRPVCLTGQAVCIIKIFGLWLALDTFSISDIHLVKIALLAALAFAEYTSAFFFAFFMAILAVDMRAKAPPPDLLN